MTSAPQPLSLRSTLLESTDELHRQAEARVGELAVFETESAYRDWLLATLQLHEFFLDTTTAAAVELGLAPIGRALVAALRVDLEHLGYESPSVSLVSAHATTRVDEMLGVFYVFEGSGLGARVLCERAAASNVATMRFLERSRDLTTGRWPRIVAALNEFADTSSVDPDRCAAAANDVFSYFISALASSDTSLMQG